MTQHKTLADEIEGMKDAAAIFAAKQGLQRDTEKFKAGADFVFEMLEVFIKEKHASQFIKKEVVSSDVENILNDIIKYDNAGKIVPTVDSHVSALARKALAALQSAQQPAIEWLNETEVYQFAYQQVYKHMPEHDRETNKQLLTEQMDLINKVQSKLKERVNCVDLWISVKDRLPELEQKVLSFSINEGIRQTKYTTYQEGSIGHSQGDKDCWFEWVTHNNFAWKHRATHWTPLLNSPKTTPNGQAE